MSTSRKRKNYQQTKSSKKPKSSRPQVPGQTILDNHGFSRGRPIENNGNTVLSEVPYIDNSTTQIYNVPPSTHNMQAANNDSLWVILDQDTAIENDMEHHDIKDGYRINMSKNKTIVPTINYAYYGYESTENIDGVGDYIDYNKITNGFNFLEEASKLVVHNFDEQSYYITDDHTVFEQLKFADYYNDSMDKNEAAEYILNKMKESDNRFYTEYIKGLTEPIENVDNIHDLANKGQFLNEHDITQIQNIVLFYRGNLRNVAEMKASNLSLYSRKPNYKYETYPTFLLDIKKKTIFVYKCSAKLNDRSNAKPGGFKKKSKKSKKVKKKSKKVKKNVSKRI
jgi:hypothetical protein